MVIEPQKSEPDIDELVYSWIKMGYDTIDELMKLKHDHRLDIITFVETLNRLEEFNLITRMNDRYLINRTQKILDIN